jgi:hypothetical protein
VKHARAAAKDGKGLAALLIRPDGFVVWAADFEPDLIGLEDSLGRWFGGDS